MPSMRSIQNTVYRQRKLAGVPKSSITSLSELIIPEGFRTLCTPDGIQEFLKYDSGPNEGSNRFLMFSTDRNLDLMKNATTAFYDGTFSIVPKIFMQLFTLHIQIGEANYPMVYFLLPNKKQTTYVAALNKLKALSPKFNPDTVMGDFEMASINAFQEIYPGVMQKSCFFHLSQAIYRNMQKYPDILELYKSDSEFSRRMRMIPALAFLPPNRVVTGFEQLEQSDYYEKHDEMLVEFLTYFEVNYIGKVCGNTRRQPKFAIP